MNLYKNEIEMKSFFNNIFKPYMFPVLLLILGAYLQVGDNLKSTGEFFSNSTNGFINFFSYQFYLWEVIFYLIVIFIFKKLYNVIFKSKSKKERLMLKAIKKTPNDFPVKINGTTDKFIFKFKAVVENEEYYFENIVPYCQNCSNNPIRMTKQYRGDFRCNCGKEVDYRTIQDMKSRIMTVFEENE